MTKNLIARAGLGALVLGCAAIGFGQSSGNLGLSPRIGAVFPTSSEGHGSFFAVGADYKLKALSSSVSGSSLGYWGVSVDYYDRGSASNLPVVLNYNMRQGSLVYSLGAGIEFYDTGGSNSSSGTGFDAQAAISYDIKTPVLPLFLQAKFFLASHDADRGIGVYAGVRF